MTAKSPNSFIILVSLLGFLLLFVYASYGNSVLSEKCTNLQFREGIRAVLCTTAVGMTINISWLVAEQFCEKSDVDILAESEGYPMLVFGLNFLLWILCASFSIQIEANKGKDGCDGEDMDSFGVYIGLLGIGLGGSFVILFLILLGMATKKARETGAEQLRQKNENDRDQAENTRHRAKLQKKAEEEKKLKEDIERLKKSQERVDDVKKQTANIQALKEEKHIREDQLIGLPGGKRRIVKAQSDSGNQFVGGNRRFGGFANPSNPFVNNVVISKSDDGSALEKKT